MKYFLSRLGTALLVGLSFGLATLLLLALAAWAFATLGGVKIVIVWASFLRLYTVPAGNWIFFWSWLSAWVLLALYFAFRREKS